MPHRSHEWQATLAQLRLAFASSAFAVHAPVPPAFGDEGAANHMRLTHAHGDPGVEVFVYGVSGGAFPARFEELAALPGIGRSTAAAIAAFASGERRAILDGNVRRVLARHAGIAVDASSARSLAVLWEIAEQRLPPRGIERYTQGMMDLGASVCVARRPQCPLCPVSEDCVARREDRIAELPGARRRVQSPRRQPRRGTGSARRSRRFEFLAPAALPPPGFRRLPSRQL
jgi:hypothetical protein